MSHIILSDEQFRVFTAATGPVELRDPRGNVLASVPPPPISEEEVAEARRRLTSNQPRWSARQVEGLLTRLNELRRQGAVDQARLQDILSRFRAGEVP
jgi:hypothetical protein